MLFKPEDLSYGYDPIQEAADILNESVYLDESESILSPMAVPVVEDRKYIDGYNVDFHFVKRISEDYGLDYIDSLDFIAESNGIRFEDIDMIVQESEIIMDPYSLSPLSNHIKIAPVNEQSFSYQYCELMLEAFLESGNMDILEMILDEGSVKKRIGKKVGSNLGDEKNQMIKDLAPSFTHIPNFKSIKGQRDDDENLTGVRGDTSSSFYGGNIPGFKSIPIKPVTNPKTGNVLQNTPANAGIGVKSRGFIDRAENKEKYDQAHAERKAEQHDKDKKHERQVGYMNDELRAARQKAQQEKEKREDLEKRTKEEARKREAEAKKKAEAEAAAKKKAEEEAAKKAEEAKKSGSDISNQTATNPKDSTPASNESQVKETLNKAVEESKDKPASWISQKIQAFRNLYKKYMEKAKSAIDQKKASIFQRISHFILNIIDTLSSKLQSATA
jgi:chemotaxis protein histidine kinase CheA